MRLPAVSPSLCERECEYTTLGLLKTSHALTLKYHVTVHTDQILTTKD